MTTSHEAHLPGPKLVQPLKDIPSGAAWLKHYESSVEQLRRKVGHEVYDRGSMYFVDLRDQVKAVEFQVALDQKSKHFIEIDRAMKGKGASLSRGFQMQIARTNQVNFGERIKKPSTEFTLLDIDRNAFEPVSPGKLYTFPSGQDTKQEVMVVGIIGTTQENNKNTGAILWFPDSFYLSDAKLAVPGGGE